MKDVKKICMTDFAKRHFDPGFGGTKITGFNPKLSLYKSIEFSLENFIDSINVQLEEFEIHPPASFVNKIQKGDYEFSRLIHMTNIGNAQLSVLRLRPEYYPFIRTGYSARTKDELPVLSEWLELPKRLHDLRPIANNLTIVLYSKEQVLKECAAQILKNLKGFDIIIEEQKEEIVSLCVEQIEAISEAKHSKNISIQEKRYEDGSNFRSEEKRLIEALVSELHMRGFVFSETENIEKHVSKNIPLPLRADWCVVAFLAHDTPEQEPMKPITMLRNAAGKEYGGNGEPIDDKKYHDSVIFWERHISLK